MIKLVIYIHTSEYNNCNGAELEREEIENGSLWSYYISMNYMKILNLLEMTWVRAWTIQAY